MLLLPKTTRGPVPLQGEVASEAANSPVEGPERPVLLNNTANQLTI